MRFYFQIEPLDRPSSGADTFPVVRPDQDGNGRWCHHSHPDSTVLDAEAGDVLVHKRTAYRVVAVQRYRNDQWFKSVRECLGGTCRPWYDADMAEPRKRRIARRVALICAAIVMLPVWYVVSWLIVSRAVHDGHINPYSLERFRPVFAPLVSYCDFRIAQGRKSWDEFGGG